MTSPHDLGVVVIPVVGLRALSLLDPPYKMTHLFSMGQGAGGDADPPTTL